MKVKCINIYNEHTKEHESKSSWLTVGKEYIVLTIEVRQNKTSYLIVSDSNQQPVLQNAIQFEIVSGKIPKNWQITSGDIVFLVMGPSAWQEPGFWEDCNDHEPKAMEIYKREARIIYEEEGAF
ncbi:hypothetical protein BH10PSE19_BH10PSE19_20650 [soil metagenome]